MRKFFIGIAAATMLPMLALGQTPNTRTFVSSGAVPNAAATAGIVTIESCSVTPLTKDGEAFVPAQEAGVIVGIDVDELKQVNKGEVMVRIDDAMVQKQFANAEAEYYAAKKKADSDVEIRVAEKAERTSFFEYQKNLEANKRHRWQEWGSQPTLVCVVRCRKWKYNIQNTNGNMPH